MDILTERGQESVAWEQEAISIWHDHFPSIRYIETPKDKPAAVDAILAKESHALAVVETKCRPQLTLQSLQTTHSNRWLITHEKIIKAAFCAKTLYVPFIGFLYLPTEKTLLWQKLWEPEAEWLVDIDVKETKTQATINGGQATRINAYIDMSKANIMRPRRG